MEPDEPVIVALCRTPQYRVKKNPTGSPSTKDLISTVVKHALLRANLGSSPCTSVEDVCFGNVLGGPAFMVTLRVGVIEGIKQSMQATCPTAYVPQPSASNVPVRAVNRQCASGLQAIIDIANQIRAGDIKVGLAGGVEVMSFNTMADSFGEGPDLGIDDDADEGDETGNLKSCTSTAIMTPMGTTSENVAKEYGIARESQDAFAYNSHVKAHAAWIGGKFDEEVVFPPNASRSTHKVEDTGVRKTTTLEKLSDLRPAFAKSGVTTAGNSSQLSDGAACVVMMSRAEAARRNLPVLGSFLGVGVAGVPPRLMGVGPAFAVPLALKNAGLNKDDVDLWEINEAFASQALHCIKELNIDPAKVNVNGGGIALGHPLGCTGTRLVVSLINELSRRGGGVGCATMCIGTGMGCAAIVEVPKSGRRASSNM